jgi:hypothetical protein
MSKTLFLLFNHSLTSIQEEDARNRLGISRIIAPPEPVSALWRQIPTELEALEGYLAPVEEWLKEKAKPGDYVLIQGDFGACYLMVRYAMQIHLITIYSTTRRDAEEEPALNGNVTLTHRFRHVAFRRYGV